MWNAGSSESVSESPSEPRSAPEPAVLQPSSPSWRNWVVDSDPGGPAVVRVFHAGLAAVSVIAWASLLMQVKLLIGWQGLTPVQSTLIQARGSNVFLRWVDFPSHMFFDDSDVSIVTGCVVGLVVSILALVGVWPRVMFAISALLYLGYCIASQTFLAFQWDNLLVEASVLAALMSRSRRSPIAHWMGVLLLFKLFFQSGLAKWGSSLGDWQSGEAMRWYYETAPLPTPLGWFFHHLPSGWHTFESWWALFFELVLAWGVCLGRVPRMVALAAFSSFLLLDFATASYGFFVPLAGVLCVLLLPESGTTRALQMVRQWVHARLSWVQAAVPAPKSPHALLRQLPLAGLGAGWFALSALTAVAHFGDVHVEGHDAIRKWRVANSYHLFTSITTRRNEPELQTSPDGLTWSAQHLKYKPGPVDRAPRWVAPHHPRVDFRLWFHGLSWSRHTPPYVANLLRRMCWDPHTVQSLFDSDLPGDTRHVRLVYWNHTYTSWAEGWSTGRWWHREKVGASRDISCEQLGW